MAHSHVFKLGYSTILVRDNEFSGGYTNGLLGYPDQPSPLTVEALHTLIVESVTDTEHIPEWNTGYIAGVIKGILEGNCKHDAEPDTPYVQVGSLILQLNRWRFRDGYYNRQHDYEVSRNDCTELSTLTARELLSYIAHRTPETNTFFFGEDECSALEDVLGQLIGYFCAALRPSPDQAHKTEPLSITVLQEA